MMVDTSSDRSLRQFLYGLPPVDQVGLEATANTFSTRSLAPSAQLWAVNQAITMIDLTTLEGADTPDRVRALCAKARQPDPWDPACPSVAAICVYGDLVPVAVKALQHSGTEQGKQIQVASVATAFPSGRAGLSVKLADTRAAIDAGADEIDMVIDRGAFLAGHYLEVFQQIVAVKAACDAATIPGGSRNSGGQGREVHLKVILETGELATYDNIRRACWLAMLAGADFIKTSTGKVAPAATVPVTALMLAAVRDFRLATKRQVGVKPAGGIRTSSQAISYLIAVNEVAGPDWLSPDWFRFGASSLLNDLLRQRHQLITGRPCGPHYLSCD